MNSDNVGSSLSSTISLLLLAVSVLGFSSLMSTVAASPIDGITTGDSNTPATTMSNNTSLNFTTTNIELGEEPFAVGRYSPVSENVINETQELQIFFEGSTTITLPNFTETITTRDTGEGIITLLPGGGVIRGQIQMTTEDGSESATVTLTEYYLDESPTAINLAFFSTNSTGMLAPLNNMIAVSLDEEQPNGDVVARFFEWEDSWAPAIGNNYNTSTNDSGNDTTITTTTETPAVPIT